MIILFLASGLALIKDDQVGILIKKMFGRKMKEGQIISRQGEIGIQAHILMPGLYWRIPIIWKIQKVPVTVINPGEIGCVKSVDGLPISPGRLLGDEVECNSFQDAKMFLDNSGGYRGPQLDTLQPGEYYINPLLFNVEERNITDVPPGYVVVVRSNVGKELEKSIAVPGRDQPFARPEAAGPRAG